MASDNGEQDQAGPGEQHWPPTPPPQQPSPWAPAQPGFGADESAQQSEPEDATTARQPPPPSPIDEGGDAPTTRYGLFTPPPRTPTGTPGEPSSEPEAPNPQDDDRTQAFSRSDMRFDVPGGPPPPGPTQHLPPIPPAPWEQQHNYPPPQVYPEPQGYQQPAPPQQPPYPPPASGYQQSPYPQAPYQPPPQGYQPPGQYGQPPYQAAEPSYPQQAYGAPPGQYGQPPYQPYQAYPTAPPKKSHLALWLVAAVVVVAAVLVAAAFIAKPGFLGFKKVLDHSAVEQTLEKSGYSNVKCNDGKNPTVKKGATFTCTADGGTKITVTIAKSNGDYTWAPTS
jgi:hypothetical protein